MYRALFISNSILAFTVIKSFFLLLFVNTEPPL